MSKIAVLLFLCSFGGATSVIAQQVYAYSSIATDDQSDNVSVYGTTSADYNTEYYYELSVSIYAFTPTNPINDLCQSGTATNDNADAEISCSFSVPSGTIFDVQSSHQVNATYLYDNVVCCGSDGWYDAYSYGLLDISGNTYSDDTTWFAPSQEPETYSQSTVINAVLNKEITKPPCNFPTGEQSLSYNFDYAGSHPYLGQFLVSLNGSGNFDGRTIGEQNYSTGGTDGCYDPSMPFRPMSVPDNSSWFGRYIQDYDGGYYFNQQIHNAYGFDNIGLVDTSSLPAGNRVQAYLQKLQSNGGGSCGLNWGQNMRMACGNSSQNFSQGNDNSIYFSVAGGQNNFTVSRQGVAITRSVP